MLGTIFAIIGPSRTSVLERISSGLLALGVLTAQASPASELLSAPLWEKLPGLTVFQYPVPVSAAADRDSEVRLQRVRLQRTYVACQGTQVVARPLAMLICLNCS